MALGYYMGKFVSEIFVSADAWAGSDLIVPTYPWILYDSQVPSAQISSGAATTSTISASILAEAEEAEAEALALAGANATVDSTII